MIRRLILALAIGLAPLAAAHAQQLAPRTDYVPQVPILVRHADGTTTEYANGLATATLRGAQALIAQTAATSGDLICVYSDITISSPIGKNGVNWWFAPGVIVARTTNAVGYIVEAQSGVSYTIGGGGCFERTIGGSGAEPATPYETGVILVNGGTLDVTCDRCKITSSLGGGESCYCLMQVSGTLSYRGRLIQTTGAATNKGGIWWEDGPMNVNCDVIESTTGLDGEGVIYHHPVPTPTGEAFITCQKLDSGAATGYAYESFNTGGTSTARMWLTAQTIRGKIVSCVGFNYFPSLQKLIGRVRQVGGELHLTTQKIGGDLDALDPHPAMELLGGETFLTVDQFEPGTAWEELASVSAGTHNLTAQDLQAATSKDGILVSGGTLNLLAGRFTNGGGGKADVKQTAGTLRIGAGVTNITATSGAITYGSTYGATPAAGGLTVLAASSSTGTGAAVLATSPTLTTPALGTPSAGTLTSCTGLPIATGVSGLGTGVATVLATPSSANLATAITDETGSSALVFANSPALVSPSFTGLPRFGTPTTTDTLSDVMISTSATTQRGLTIQGKASQAADLFRVVESSNNAANNGISMTATGEITTATSGTRSYFNGGVLILANGAGLRWSSSTSNPFATQNTGLYDVAAGVVGVQGVAGVGATFSHIGKTPTTIAANQNDYNPGGTSYFQRWSTDASRNVTGLTFTPTKQDGQRHEIWNVGSFAIVLVNESASSTAANRFHNSTGADITLSADQCADVIYDNTTARWRVTKRN